jgi:phosphate transport system permease protein
MRRFVDKLLTLYAWSTGLGVLVGVAGLLTYLAFRGGGELGLSLFFADTPVRDAVLGRRPVFDGIWPALVGTLALVLSAVVLAVPIGIASGIHLAEYASPRCRAVFGLAIDTLASVPSIVMGLFGFTLILFLRRTLFTDANTSLLLAAVCIALLVLPYIIRTTQTALQGLPPQIRLIGPSLGLTPLQNFFHVLLPSASRGILSGVILAIGRAAEDTAVIMLTGAVASGGLPRGLTEKFEAIPFHIYVVAAEYRSAAELDRGYGCALFLLVVTGGLFLGATQLQRSLEKRWIR